MHVHIAIVKAMLFRLNLPLIGSLQPLAAPMFSQFQANPSRRHSCLRVWLDTGGTLACSIHAPPTACPNTCRRGCTTRPSSRRLATRASHGACPTATTARWRCERLKMWVATFGPSSSMQHAVCCAHSSGCTQHSTHCMHAHTLSLIRLPCALWRMACLACRGLHMAANSFYAVPYPWYVCADRWPLTLMIVWGRRLKRRSRRCGPWPAWLCCLRCHTCWAVEVVLLLQVAVPCLQNHPKVAARPCAACLRPPAIHHAAGHLAQP